jgi:hypothetical protein
MSENLGSHVGDTQRLAVVELGFEFVDERNVDIAFLQDALSSLRGLPLAGNVRVVVTSEMARSLAARIDRYYSTPFHQKRIMGRVTAKTVTDHASSTEILVDAVALQPDVRSHVDASLERVLAHEGRHLVLRQRGEDAHSCVRALSPTPEDLTIWIAALAIEEYRIETALCANGSFSLAYEHVLPGALDDWSAALTTAMDKWGSNQGPILLELANEIITRSAYVAAAHHNGEPLGNALLSHPAWTKLVGECWDDLLELTQHAPSADETVEMDDLLRIITEAARLVASWCAHLGFRIDADEGGPYLIAVEELPRVPVAAAQTEARGAAT